MFKLYLEAARQTRTEYQKATETHDGADESALIPVPKGYYWTSNAGGYFSYDKKLKNGNVVAISGPQGNSRLQIVDPKEDDSDELNAAFLYKNDEKDGEPLKMHFFKTEAELKAILAKIDK